MGDMALLFAWGMKILLWTSLGYAALYLVCLPFLLLARRTKVLRVLTLHLFVLPILLAALQATFIIFAWQVRIIWSASRGSMPPHEALRVGLREKLRREGLAAPGSGDDPYRMLIDSSPGFAQSGYAGAARWTVRAAGRALSVYDLALLAVLLASFLAVVIPVSVDILGHPWRREGFLRMLWTVFRRLLAMLLYLLLGGIVFTLFALLFNWLTYLMTGLASGLIADVSFAAARESGFFVFLQVLAAAVFLVETTTVLALSMVSLSLATSAGIKLRLNAWLLGEPRPAARMRDAVAGFLKLAFKLAVVGAVAFLSVRTALWLLGSTALPLCVLIETLGFNAALWLLRAHRDAKRLVVACWRLNTFGLRRAA
ncbi:MAG: hypothetical protein HYY17_15295 [Planctomycetes bacterium]|nr:hypothetical protein [Planctomycetota bacterium]